MCVYVCALLVGKAKAYAYGTDGRTDGGKDGGREGRGGRRHIIFLRLNFEFLLSGMDLKPNFLLDLDPTFLLNTPVPFNTLLIFNLSSFDAFLFDHQSLP